MTLHDLAVTLTLLQEEAKDPQHIQVPKEVPERVCDGRAVLVQQVQEDGDDEHCAAQQDPHRLLKNTAGVEFSQSDVRSCRMVCLA